jgi:Tfp pilus assembly protein PilO
VIPLPFLPWIILGVTLLVGAAGATGYWKGSQHTADQIAAQEAREAALVQKTRETAAQAAAEQISKIEVRNVTIRQKAETITREVPVYGDCKHDPRTLGLLNDALTPGGEAKPPSDGKLPRPDAP